MNIERGVPELPLAEGRGLESAEWLAELENLGSPPRKFKWSLVPLQN